MRISDWSSDVCSSDLGLTDASEGSANIIAYGSAAAVRIGSATAATTIGPVAADSSGYGLIVKGTITGQGVYNGVSANGLAIGGLGGDVTLAKGLLVSGSVGAASYDSNATAIRLGSGATADTIQVGGAVSATGSSVAGMSARALVIDAGATSRAIVNSGAISATALSSKDGRSEEHTSELQSLMRISYAVFCLKKKKTI